MRIPPAQRRWHSMQTHASLSQAQLAWGVQCFCDAFLSLSLSAPPPSFLLPLPPSPLSRNTDGALWIWVGGLLFVAHLSSLPSSLPLPVGDSFAAFPRRAAAITSHQSKEGRQIRTGLPTCINIGPRLFGRGLVVDGRGTRIVIISSNARPSAIPSPPTPPPPTVPPRLHFITVGPEPRH